jgi:enoyl-CoA hydratase
MSSETTEIRLERSGHVAEVVLCRPEKRNAMSPRFFAEIGQAFEAIDADDDVRVAILRAEGPMFSAGLDLKQAGSILFGEASGSGKKSPAISNEAQYRAIRDLQDCFTRVERCRKPVIAAVQGKCVGGGVDLIAACDIRLCTADASFSIFEVKVAIVADVGTLQRITPIVGKGMAREMAYTARFVPADRALGCGLVNEVHADPEALLAAARLMADEIAENSPLAVQGTKLVLNYSDEHSTDEGLEYVAQWNASRLRSNDLHEAMAAFVEKRKPKFTGD